MKVEDDFIESEIKYVLDKLNSMCKRVNRDEENPSPNNKLTQKDPGSEANSGNKRSS